ncbi:MAG: phosphonoacetaldehyde reductase [Bacteroidales bacterium]
MVQKVYRKDQLDELRGALEATGAGKIFVVRGDRSYGISGAESFVNKLLGNSKADSFHNFDPNPQLHDLEKGVARFRKGNYELILAIGGGSVLDMAKLISVFAHHETDIIDVVKGKSALTGGKTPLLAIPTTAGTGAEATKFAVLYIDKTKYSVEHPLILPDQVYLSPDFSTTADPYLTACTGLDALCQAVESIWSVNANSVSEEFALRAVEIIWGNLQQAVLHNNAAARENMVEAAYLAGRAINITRTTAPHALSYPFTSYYGIPHGHAVALSLPFFLNFNYLVTNENCTDKRGVKTVKERIDKVLRVLKANISDAPTLLTELFSSIGVNINIHTLIDGLDPRIIIEHVNTERLTNNPRIVTEKDIRSFLQVQKK